MASNSTETLTSKIAEIPTSEWATLRGESPIRMRAIVLAVELDFLGYELIRFGQMLRIRERNKSATERNILTDEVKKLITELKDALLVVVDYLEAHKM